MINYKTHIALLASLLLVACSSGGGGNAPNVTANSTLSAQTINLQQLSTTFSNPIGVDYHEPTDSLILSANYFSGLPHNLERILFDGTHVQFSALAGACPSYKQGSEALQDPVSRTGSCS